MKVISLMTIPLKGKILQISKTYESLRDCELSFIRHVEQLDGKMSPPTEDGAYAHVIREKNGPKVVKPEWSLTFGGQGGLIRNWLKG